MKIDMAVCQNLVPLVNIKIAGKWMFIPLKMVLIGIDPYPHAHVLGNAWMGDSNNEFYQPLKVPPSELTHMGTIFGIT